MYIIQRNNVITLNRGDSLTFPVSLWEGDFPHRDKLVLEGEDIALFALMEPNQPFERAMLKKQFTGDDFNEANDLEITLEPEDTIGLNPGTYYYQIKILYKDELGNSHIDTVIQKTKFILVD